METDRPPNAQANWRSHEIFRCKHIGSSSTGSATSPFGRDEQGSVKSNLIILGIGNPLVSADSLALFAVKRISEFSNEEVCIINLEDRFSIITEILQRHKQVVFIDSVSSGGQPGSLIHFHLTPDALAIKELEKRYSYRTIHSLSWIDELRMFNLTHGWPAKVLFIGIESNTGQDWTKDTGEPIVDDLRHTLNDLFPDWQSKDVS